MLRSLLTLSLLAAAAAADITTREVPYRDGETALRGYFASPDGGGDLPAVIVVHAWRGHSDYARRRAEMLAELGYAAFALDMYGDGVVAQDSQEASQLAGRFYEDRDLLRRRFKAAYDTVASIEGVDGGRVGAIGYCFGGTVVLEMARTGADAGVDLAGVVSFHGGLRFPDAALEGRVAPSLICNGNDDPVVPVEERRAFLDSMEEAGADFVFIEYADAVHSFTNPESGPRGEGASAYDEKADERSWAHMKLFLAETLGGAGERDDADGNAAEAAAGYLDGLTDLNTLLSGIGSRMDAMRSLPQLSEVTRGLAPYLEQLTSLSPDALSSLGETFGVRAEDLTSAIRGQVQRLKDSGIVGPRLATFLEDLPLWTPQTGE